MRYYSQIDDVQQTLELVFIKFTGMSIEPMILDDLLVRWRPTCYAHPAALFIKWMYSSTCERLMKHVYRNNDEVDVEVICGAIGRTETSFCFRKWASRPHIVSLTRARFGLFIVDRLLDREMYIRNFNFSFITTLARGDCCRSGCVDLEVCTMCHVAVCNKCKKKRRIHDHCNCSPCHCRRCRGI